MKLFHKYLKEISNNLDIKYQSSLINDPIRFHNESALKVKKYYKNQPMYNRNDILFTDSYFEPSINSLRSSLQITKNDFDLNVFKDKLNIELENIE